MKAGPPTQLAAFGVAVLAAAGPASGGGARAPETISGTFLGQGVECPQLRLTTGQQISLMGPLPDLEVGDTVTLSGRWATVSTCMQGRAFQIVPADGDK